MRRRRRGRQAGRAERRVPRETPARPAAAPRERSTAARSGFPVRPAGSTPCVRARLARRRSTAPPTAQAAPRASRTEPAVAEPSLGSVSNSGPVSTARPFGRAHRADAKICAPDRRIFRSRRRGHERNGGRSTTCVSFSRGMRTAPSIDMHRLIAAVIAVVLLAAGWPATSAAEPPCAACCQQARVRAGDVPMGGVLPARPGQSHREKGEKT